MREARWKLVSLYGHAWELYDFDADRSELHDVSKEHPEIAERLARAWDEWAEPCHVRKPKESALLAAPPPGKPYERED